MGALPHGQLPFIRQWFQGKSLFLLGVEKSISKLTSPSQNFLPTVIETLGYGRTATLALTCPPYLFAGGVSIAVSWSSGRFNERTWHATIIKLVAIGGFALSVATLNVPARFVGIMLFVGATYGVNNIILGWTASVVGQTAKEGRGNLHVQYSRKPR